MVLGKLQGPGPIAHAVCAGGACLDIFILSFLSSFFLSLWGTADID